MSVNITFYNFTKRDNETLQPSGGTEIACVLKEPTDFEAPSFIITGNHFEYTYAKWDSHYYFVTGVRSLGANRCEVSCDLDRLATYKTQIGNTSAFIERAASAYNGSLIDALFPTTSNITLQTVQLSHLLAPPRTRTGRNILISTACGDSNVPQMMGMAHYALYPMTLKLLEDELYADSLFDNIFTSAENPLQYVTGARVYPFNIEGAASVGNDPLVLGNWTAPNIGVIAETDSIYHDSDVFTLPEHPQAAAMPWANHSPYTKFTLHYPPFGDFQLDPDLLMNSPTREIGIYIDVDLLSGMGTLTISNNNFVFVRASTKIGVDIPVSQISGATIGDIISLGTGLVSSGAMIASGNVIGGALTGAASIGNAIEASIPKMSRFGGQGSLASYENAPSIDCEFTEIIESDNTHFGRPLCAVRTINTLSGFVKCSNASVAISGSDRSRSIINNYLNTGFYYT